MLVTYLDEPPRVEILTLEGIQLNSISQNDFQAPLFKHPDYVFAVDTSGETEIYVSDSVQCTVIKLSYDGKVLFRYTHRDLYISEGLAVTSDGHFFICSWENKRVFLVSPDNKQKQILHERLETLENVQSICYNEDKDVVYVAGESKLIVAFRNALKD